MKFTNLERLLPFGYLLLVILGLIKESVFYYQLNVNILNYTSLSDILISPIADFTSQPLILITCIIYIALIYVAFLFLLKSKNKRFLYKLLRIDENKMLLTEEEVKIKAANKFIQVSVACIICFFLGIGIGTGNQVTKKIKTHKITYNYLLEFEDESQEVYLIGSNSIYHIYLEKGNKNIKISPVGVIKSLQKIN